MKVLNIRLKLREVGERPAAADRALDLAPLGSAAVLGLERLDRWSSRKRWWQLVHSISGSENDSRCPDASQTRGAMMMGSVLADVVAQLHVERHQARLMLFFSSTPSGP